MDRNEAKTLAMNYLDDRVPRYAGELRIMDEFTVETDNSWIFFYQHRNWVEKRIPRSRLSGNHPVEVFKDGKMIKNVSDERCYEFEMQFRATRDAQVAAAKEPKLDDPRATGNNLGKT
jgi:hypothetical protein